MSFSNRVAAGRRLAAALESYAGEAPVVVGLPRGGVVVAAEVARELRAPLDLCVVRKIGAPWYPELGIGAVAEGGFTFLNDSLVVQLQLAPEEVESAVRNQTREVEARVARFRGATPPIEVSGKTVIVVDDGIATGGTVHAALMALRARGAGKLVLAVPVASSQSLGELQTVADETVCLISTPELIAVGAWYEEFEQVEDGEVQRLLDEARARPPPSPAARGDEVTIESSGARLEGTLTVPPGATGLVLFAHGSGSGRKSPRNTRVAAALHRAGIATLLFDLLTPDEAKLDELTAELRFDIGHLSRRLVRAAEWAKETPETRELRLGFYGASTGAAAALVAAASSPGDVTAVVSRGGRPDLAGAALEKVRAPSLFIVGSDDPVVLELNREAISQMHSRTELVVVPGASHLFEEPGTLDEVALLTVRFFSHWLKAAEERLQPDSPLG